MWFENKGTYIVAHKDEGDDHTIHSEEFLEQAANSIDITFADLLNEGFPVAWGNTHFMFEFTAYVEGLKFQYSIGANETAELNDRGYCILCPYAFVDLEN